MAGGSGSGSWGCRTAVRTSPLPDVSAGPVLWGFARVQHHQRRLHGVQPAAGAAAAAEVSATAPGRRTPALPPGLQQPPPIWSWGDVSSLRPFPSHSFIRNFRAPRKATLGSGAAANPSKVVPWVPEPPQGAPPTGPCLSASAAVAGCVAAPPCPAEPC